MAADRNDAHRGRAAPRGLLRWRIEKDGFETVYAAAPTFTFLASGWQPVPFHRTLDRKGSLPSGMTRVEGAASPVGDLPPFLIDIHEVTNSQFKAFADAGGYSRREFWKSPLRQGR